MRYVDLLEDPGTIYYFGSNGPVETLEPTKGSLGDGIYITTLRISALAQAKRRASLSGGEPTVVPIKVPGKILWKDSKQHKEVIQAATTIVQRHERLGKRTSLNDAVRAGCDMRGYVGMGTQDTICIFDPKDIQIVPTETNAT